MVDIGPWVTSDVGAHLFEWHHVKSDDTTSPSDEIVYAAEFTVQVACSGAPLLIEMWGHAYMSGSSGEAYWTVEPRWDGTPASGGQAKVHSSNSGGGPWPFYSRILLSAPTPGEHIVDWHHWKSSSAAAGIYASATYPLQARIHELQSTPD